MQLSVNDLIELATFGRTVGIELDSMASTVLHECLNMLTTKSKTAKARLSTAYLSKTQI